MGFGANKPYRFQLVGLNLRFMREFGISLERRTTPLPSIPDEKFCATGKGQDSGETKGNWGAA